MRLETRPRGGHIFDRMTAVRSTLPDRDSKLVPRERLDEDQTVSLRIGQIFPNILCGVCHLENGD